MLNQMLQNKAQCIPPIARLCGVPWWFRRLEWLKKAEDRHVMLMVTCIEDIVGMRYALTVVNKQEHSSLQALSSPGLTDSLYVDRGKS